MSGSIEILKSLFSGGAHVVATTFRNSRATVEYYRESSSVSAAVVPLLLSSPSTKAPNRLWRRFFDYIYMTLRLDLDYVIPFAAVPENGCEIDGLRQV